jgi:hypothetical protein
MDRSKWGIHESVTAFQLEALQDGARELKRQNIAATDKRKGAEWWCWKLHSCQTLHKGFGSQSKLSIWLWVEISDPQLNWEPTELNKFVATDLWGKTALTKSLIWGWICNIMLKISAQYSLGGNWTYITVIKSQGVKSWAATTITEDITDCVC